MLAACSATLPTPCSSYFDLAIFDSGKACWALVAGVIWVWPTAPGFSTSREQLITISLQLLNKRLLDRHEYAMIHGVWINSTMYTQKTQMSMVLLCILIQMHPSVNTISYTPCKQFVGEIQDRRRDMLLIHSRTI